MKTIREIIHPRKESEPWNKGKIIGQKPPLLPKHVWAIRTKLQMEKRVRELVLFNLAIDSRLRGYEATRLRYRPIALGGCRAEWLRHRASHHSSAKDRSSGQVRTN